jgi:uncharacterized protein (DUF488 family)
MPAILSIGHSNHSPDGFLALLAGAGVEMIADVRSTPYSRRQPQFNKPALAHTLAEAGIAYLFLGRELGGRPTDPDLFSDGIADFERMAQSSAFQSGIVRLKAETEWLRLCLMCAEKDPRDCHRCLLVGRALTAEGVEVRHVLGDGTILLQTAIEDDWAGEDDLLVPRAERLNTAYRERARKIAYRVR